MSWLAVALFGGVVGLDTTSFPQVMISRPLVASTLTGAIFGRPVEGLVIGFILEAFDLVTLPVGAALYPDSGTAAVAATAAYLAVVESGVFPGPLALAVAFGLLWEWVGGRTVVLHRRNNGRFLSRSGGMTPDQLERGHVMAMGVDFLRAAVVAGSGALIGYALISLATFFWALPDSWTVNALLLLVAAVVGTPLALFGGGRSHRLALGAGVAVGLGLVVLL